MSKQFIKRARADLLDDLSATLLELNAEQPKLVAIDGRSAAGKTTLADELALMVRLQGRPVLRCSMDDFHPPGHKYRSRERPYTPLSYYVIFTHKSRAGLWDAVSKIDGWTTDMA